MKPGKVMKTPHSDRGDLQRNAYRKNVINRRYDIDHGYDNEVEMAVHGTSCKGPDSFYGKDGTKTGRVHNLLINRHDRGSDDFSDRMRAKQRSELDATRKSGASKNFFRRHY
jgi:hypothetical protein